MGDINAFKVGNVLNNSSAPGPCSPGSSSGSNRISFGITTSRTSTALFQAKAVMEKLVSDTSADEPPTVNGLSFCTEEHALERTLPTSNTNPARAYATSLRCMINIYKQSRGEPIQSSRADRSRG